MSTYLCLFQRRQHQLKQSQLRRILGRRGKVFIWREMLPWLLVIHTLENQSIGNRDQQELEQLLVQVEVEVEVEVVVEDRPKHSSIFKGLCLRDSLSVCPGNATY